jgi:hypothetical protein
MKVDGKWFCCTHHIPIQLSKAFCDFVAMGKLGQSKKKNHILDGTGLSDYPAVQI